MPVMLFWCYYCQLWTHLTLYSIVFIVDFELIVARCTWDVAVSDKFILNIYGKNINLLGWKNVSG